MDLEGEIVPFFADFMCVSLRTTEVCMCDHVLACNVHSLISNSVARFLSLVIWLPAQVAWLIFHTYQLARGRGEVAAWRENFGSNSEGEPLQFLA